MNDANEPSPPDEFADSNHRGNDPWDHDAVSWLLLHDDVARDFTYHNLFECARRQKARLEKDIDNVLLAAYYCGKYGVQQLRVVDPRIGKTVWRLRRTDAGAPSYPLHVDRPGHLVVTAADRDAAERLLPLVDAWEHELQAAGKSANTVLTYTDRTRRFLRRILDVDGAVDVADE